MFDYYSGVCIPPAILKTQSASSSRTRRRTSEGFSPGSLFSPALLDETIPTLCSDTLFLAGCGRFFEGTAEEMHAALTHLGKLPDDTLVFNGHEYSKGSTKFGLTVEPDNEALKGWTGS